MEKLMTKKYTSYIIKVVLLLISALIQTFVIQVFLVKENLIAGGFTGLALLIKFLASYIGIHLSVSFLIFILNLPVAILCMKTISNKFVIYSLIQIISTSIFLEIVEFQPVFNNTILNITIGAVVYGISVTLALKVGGSTGGTDFIALYISSKINKTIWEYIFVFNMILILIFGSFSGWDNAGYSIIFQFITTKTITTFYNRYHRITMQIITTKPEEIINVYIDNYSHGITQTMGKGGYTGNIKYVCYTVVSVYEVEDIANLFLKIDNKIIINTFKTEKFYGNFYVPEI